MPLEIGPSPNSQQNPIAEFAVNRNARLKPVPDPTWIDLISAGFERENIITGLFVNDHFQNDPEFTDPNFDPLELENQDLPFNARTNQFRFIAGYEDSMTSFANARSVAEIDFLKSKIDRENENTRTLSRGGVSGIAVSMVAGVADPLILIPGVAFVKGAKGVKILATAKKSAALAASAVATQEVILQNQQETRTFAESALNITGATLLGGLFGAGLAKLKRGQFNKLKSQFDDYLNINNGKDSAFPIGSVAEAEDFVKFADSLRVKNAFGFERIAAWANQRLPAFMSIPIAGKVGNKLFRPGVKVKGQLAFSAETFLDIQMARTNLTVEGVEGIFLEAAQGRGKKITQQVFGIGTGPSIDGIGTIDDFWIEIARHMRGAPAKTGLVEEAAQILRRGINEPIINRALELNLIDKGLLVEQSRYLTTMWDPERLRGGDSRRQLLDTLVDDGRRAHLERADLDEFGDIRAFDETAFRDRMNSWINDRIAIPMSRNLPGRSMKTRGIFMERTLDFIDDYNRYDQWLVNDPRIILRRYSRSGWSEVALAERFGLTQSRKLMDSLVDGTIKEIRTSKGKVKGAAIRRMNKKIAESLDESKLLDDALESGARDQGVKITLAADELAEQISTAASDDAARLILKNNNTTLIRNFSGGDMELGLDQVITGFAKAAPEPGASPRVQRKAIKEQERVIRSLENGRDFVRGLLDIPADPTAVLPRVLMGARKAVHTMLGGSIGLSSIPDVGLAMTNLGFRRVFGTGFDAFVGNLGKLKLRKEEARWLLGPSLIVNDSVTMSRMAMGIEELTTSAAPTRVERALEKGVRFTNYTSLATPWNQSIRDLVVFSTMSMIDDLGVKLTKGQRVRAKDLERVAELGLNEDVLKRIGNQFLEHSKVVDGAQDIMAPNVRAWTDKVASDAFQNAVRIADDMTLLKGSPLDRPALNWMSPEWKGVIFQFMGFSLTATSRISTRALQSLRAGDLSVLNGIGMMVGLGGLSVYLKGNVRGTALPGTPAEWTLAGIQQSGVLGILDQVDGVLTQVTKGKVGISPLFGKNRFYSPDSLIGAIFGPVAGKTVELFDGIRGFADFDPEPGDVERMRRVMFLQNHWALSRLFDAAEEAIGKAVAD